MREAIKDGLRSSLAGPCIHPQDWLEWTAGAKRGDRREEAADLRSTLHLPAETEY